MRRRVKHGRYGIFEFKTVCNVVSNPLGLRVVKFADCIAETALFEI
ncbi:hypothetical protein CAMRE0001_1711 [Campylobacter rectus RM3267]|uniref:Uncharacterized protein n=1 Tax=Campylobacter rectus RM3267 TaxID=553218 RepID=B9CZC3_CAMRE|nr:hypothetical protein CAMRE0001_1711 [Campylobacter rectus RM3267]